MVLAGSLLIAGCKPEKAPAQENKNNLTLIDTSNAQDAPQSAFLKLYGAKNSAQEEQRLVAILLGEAGADKAYMLLKDNKVADADAQAVLVLRLVDEGSLENMQAIALTIAVKNPSARAALFASVISDAQPDVILALLESGVLTSGWPTEGPGCEKQVEMVLVYNGTAITLKGNIFQAVEMAAIVDILANWDFVSAVRAYISPNWQLENSKELIALKLIAEMPAEIAQEMLKCTDVPADLQKVLKEIIKTRKQEEQQEKKGNNTENIRMNGV